MDNKLKLLLTGFLLAYLLPPVIFRYSPFIQRNLLFMNNFNSRFSVNLSRPEEAGLKCVRTLMLRNEFDKQEIAEIGVWHIASQSSLGSCVTQQDINRTSIADEKAFADTRPIVLYVHGNGGNRAGQHRTNLYLKLAYEFDYHVVTFDYRGYGDSSQLYPSSNGLTSDARTVFEWLIKQTGVSANRIRVWGHSLGTAVASRMVSELPAALQPPKLVLEAPFDTLANAIANHPFALPFKILPYFEFFFVTPVRESPFYFDSVAALRKIKQTQIMIMHAQDDSIIPIGLSKNLYDAAVELLGESRVSYVEIGQEFQLGHKYICKHSETMTKAQNFLAN